MSSLFFDVLLIVSFGIFKVNDIKNKERTLRMLELKVDYFSLSNFIIATININDVALG